MVDVQVDISDDLEPEVSDYFELLKPKVMRLVVFTSAIGLFAAPHSLHPVIAFASLLCVATGAGAAGALNMWWDCLLYTSPSPRDGLLSRMPSSA